MGRKLRFAGVLLPASIVAACLVVTAQASAFERLEQYGTGYPSAGSGGLSVPGGIAVAPDGTVVVSDIGFNRVSVFSQAGQFQRAFGTDVSTGGGTGAEVCTSDCKQGNAAGAGAGELGTPWGVAVSANEIYVSEYNHDRVSVFDFQGHFLRAFGADVGGPGVNLCTAVCQAGTAGAGAGQMEGPTGISLDGAGELLIAEAGTARIDVFNPQNGQFIRAFGKDVGGPGVNVCTVTCFTGTADATPGALSEPLGVTAAPNGEAFVADTQNGRISIFGPEGVFRRTIGSPGSAAGQFEKPNGVAFDLSGNIYVTDTENRRLDTFNSAGAFLSGRGYGVDPASPKAAGVCAAACQTGGTEEGVGSFFEAKGIASDCRGAIYVGMLGRVEKYGEPAARKPPCESNAFSFGPVKKNKKKGTLSVEVEVPGPGTLSATAGLKLAVTVPQPTAAGALQLVLKASGKGVKALAKAGKLKGSLNVTFTPPNEDPKTQAEAVQLAKTVKKHKKAGKHKGGKHHH